MKAIALILGIVIGAHAAPLGNGSGFGLNGGTMSALSAGTITGATAFFVNAVYDSGSAIPTWNDACGNSAWSHGTARAGSLSGTTTQIFYIFSPTICGGTYTLASTCTSCATSFQFTAYGGGTYSFRAEAFVDNSTVVLTNPIVGPVTSVSGDLVVSGIGYSATGVTFSAAAPLTITDQVGQANGNNYGSVMATGSATGVTTTVTWNANNGPPGAITLTSFAFTPAASGTVRHRVSMQ